jgi:hypothetical protein
MHVRSRTATAVGVPLILATVCFMQQEVRGEGAAVAA